MKFFTKTLVLMAIVLMQAATALAGATLSIKDLKVVKNNTYTIEVMLDSDEPIGGIDGTITLPSGVTYVSNSIKKGSTLPSGYSIRYVESTRRFTLNNSTSSEKIATGSRLLFSFDVAVGDLSSNVEITISDLFLANSSYGNAATSTEVSATLTPTEVLCEVNASPASIEIDESGEETIVVSLNCSELMVGAQMTITLPAGLELVDGSAASGALLTDHAISISQKGSAYTAVIVSQVNSAFSDKSGELFSFKVQPTSLVAAGAQIVINTIRFSNAAGQVTKADNVAIDVSVNEEDCVLTASPETAEVTGEEELTVSLLLESPANKVAAEMKIALPEGLELVENSVANGSLLADHEVRTNYVEAQNVYNVVIISGSNTAFTAQSGELISFKVKATDAIADGAVITVSDIRLSNKAGQVKKIDAIEIPVTYDAGVTLGDVNGDGVINTVDATYVLKYLVGSAPADFIEAAADVDGNGTINTSDATAILRSMVQ
ncbi:MAG: hypothetical protein IJ841_03605 [Prevotella sp.]|nr:hypothetical protein [Prevotella sp.]